MARPRSTGARPERRRQARRVRPCRRAAAISRSFTSATWTRRRTARDRLDWAKFTTISVAVRRQRLLLHQVPRGRRGGRGRRELLLCRLLPPRRRDPQAIDRLVFDHARSQRRSSSTSRSRDGDRLGRDHRVRGLERQERDVYVLDRRDRDGRSPPALRGVSTDSSTFVGAADGRLFFRTDSDAPAAGASSRVDPQPHRRRSTEVVARAARQAVVGADRRTVARGRLPAPGERSRPPVRRSTGARTREVALPGLGTRFGHRRTARTGPDLLIGFTSFTHPPTQLSSTSLESRRLTPVRGEHAAA